MKERMKELIVIYALKTAIALTVFGGFVGLCGGAESIADAFTQCSDNTSVRVMLIGDDIATDIDGNKYVVHTDYEYGDIISITLNPHGRVVGVNGKCWIQSLD